MVRGKEPAALPADAPTTEKVVISFRLPASLARALRKTVEEEGGSLNDVVVNALDDLNNWFAAPKPVAEQLEADRQAFGDSRREYLRRLLQYRYDDLSRGAEAVGKRPGTAPVRK